MTVVSVPKNVWTTIVTAGADTIIENLGHSEVFITTETPILGDFKSDKLTITTLQSGETARVYSVNKDTEVNYFAVPSGVTDLTYTAATRLLESSTGTDVTLPLVGADAGLMTAADKTKLDGIETGAEVNVPYAYGQLTSNYTLTSTTAQQKLFNWSTNGALTLATGLYRFNSKLHILSMSATSGNGEFSLRGAGTATFVAGSVLYQVTGIDATNPEAEAAMTGSASNTSTGQPDMVAATVGTGLIVDIDGIFDVSTAGTIIPSIALTTAAAAIVQAGSYFECIRIGDTGANTLGSWS